MSGIDHRRLLNLVMILGCAIPAVAQSLGPRCVVSVMNRTVTVKPDGSWVLPNLPANFGRIRARVTCVENGITRFGSSDWFQIPANGVVRTPPVSLEDVGDAVTNRGLCEQGSTPLACSDQRVDHVHVQVNP